MKTFCGYFNIERSRFYVKIGDIYISLLVSPTSNPRKRIRPSRLFDICNHILISNIPLTQINPYRPRQLVFIPVFITLGFIDKVDKYGVFLSAIDKDKRKDTIKKLRDEILKDKD